MRTQQTHLARVFGSISLLLVFLPACYFRPANEKEPAALTPAPATPSMISGPVNYVALGDSTGVGIGAREGGYVARVFKRMAAKRPGSKVTNLCVNGATTADVLREQVDAAIRANPNLVTLGIGINDIGHSVSPEEFSKDYDEVLTRLRETRATIVVNNIPDISSAPRIPASMQSQYHQLIVAFNRRLEEIAARHGVTVFDVYTLTHQELPLHREYFSADGFHPSDKGYELWAERMWPEIARTIGVE